MFSQQEFFPGSEPTSWESCDKFGTPGNEIQICASAGTLPGSTSPTYNIRFSLPGTAHVQISVFDSNAALVKVLLDAEEPATLPGFFRQPPVSWNYTDAQGNPVGSGAYRFYFQSDDYVSTSDLELD